MAKRNTYQDPITIAKNAIRGTIGKESELFKALTATIESLSANQIHAFVTWVIRYPSKKFRIFPPSKITDYSGLNPHIFVTITDLSKQLRWTTELLLHHLPLIDTSLKELCTYEHAFMSNDFARARESLEPIQECTGLSIWLIEANIATLQRLEGLESQKAYTVSIHDALPGSLTAFIAHYYSQRNEESISFERFALRVRTQIDAQSVPDEVKCFMRTRLLGRLLAPFDALEISSSLSVASVFSIIDAYESLIESFQELLRRPPTESEVSSVRYCLSQLRVDDWRLYKLRGLISEDFASLPLRDSKADDLLLDGSVQDSRAEAIKHLADHPLDIDALIVAVNATSEQEAEVADIPDVAKELSIALSSLRTKRAIAKGGDDLSKLILNMRTVRVANALVGYLALTVLDYPQVRHSHGTALYQSSCYLNPRHWIVLPDRAAEELIDSCIAMGDRSLSVEIAADQFYNRLLSSKRLSPELLMDLTAAAAFYHGDYAKALRCAEDLSHSPLPFWQKNAITLELNCLIATDQFHLALRRVASLCSTNDDLRYVLPLRSLLGAKRWRDVNEFAADIALPIAFDLYIRTVAGTEHETNRRIAYDEFLRAHKVRRPSELASLTHEFPREQLIYFLQVLCIPHVMDVSFQTYKTSRAIEEERIRVCSLLAELDPDRSSVYKEEIKDLTKYLTIQDGLRDVDRSRVYVNTEAVARWAEREVSESFVRYKELLRAGIGFGSREEFDLAIRKIAEGDHELRESLLKYPKQEGDSLLIDMFESIKREYLSNADYGLDAYLSMRIRHGSLSGYMRGPLEERSLIVSKDETSGRYTDNLGLIEQLGISADAGKRAINEAFRTFAEKYDSIVEDLTKDRLQIRRSDKPQGMFAVNLESQPWIILWLRTRIQADTTFVEFLDLVLSSIELVLQQVLLNVRDYIVSTSKPTIRDAFETLRTDLQDRLPGHVYARLNSILADVIPEIQAAVERVAEWFVPIQKKQEARIRTMDEILDVGIEATKHAHRGFVPNIVHRDVDDIGIQSTTSLSEFTDVFFTILDNVYSHSGDRISPWVRIEIRAAEGRGVRRRIRIRVESEVAPRAHSDAIVQKLSRIREQMNSGDYRKRVNLEGGTGLLKLKRLVSLDPSQSLDFGFLSEDCFFVEIGLEVLGIPPPGTMEDVA